MLILKLCSMYDLNVKRVETVQLLYIDAHGQWCGSLYELLLWAEITKYTVILLFRQAFHVMPVS